MKMKTMVKIFINNTAVYLLERKDKQLIDKKYPEENITHVKFSGKESLLLLIERAEKDKKESAVLLEHENADELFNIFKSFYKSISAAGGVVKNQNSEMLMIFRRGKWDLPKGKVEKHESAIEAAVREVQEETGLKKVKADNLIYFYPWHQLCTYHTYFISDKRILKDTQWFSMQCADTSLPHPQVEEEITKAEWVPQNKIPDLMKNTYGSIVDVIKYSVW